jgi:integrase
MASILKQKYTVKDKNGKTVRKQSRFWYIDYKTADGTRKRVKGFKDKAATTQLAAKLEREAEQEQLGIVDKYKQHRTRPLTKHMDDFRASLAAKGNTEQYVEQTLVRIRRVFEECKFVYWKDISANVVQRYLASQRNAENGIGAQTSNYYLQGLKEFCGWMVQNQRASESPLEHLKGVNVRTDRRHDRRTLEPNELRRLLEATATGPTRFGMSGYERYLLYRFGAETGLRANEIRRLKVGDFDFDNLRVTVRASYSKRRREDVEPLRPDTGILLKEFFQGKMPNVKAFGGTYKRLTKRTSDMIRADLAATEIKDEDGKIAEEAVPYIDDAGRYADFHSLRHTTGSLLAASGVHPKVAQSIMRHSNIDLTMSRYTHTLRGQESEAVAKLPDLSLPSKQAEKATGTDDQAVTGAYKKLAKNSYFDGLSSSPIDTADKRSEVKDRHSDDSHKSLEGAMLGTNRKGLAVDVTGDTVNTPGRIRTCDLRIRNLLRCPTEPRALLS